MAVMKMARHSSIATTQDYVATDDATMGVMRGFTI